uniref:Uncharacterized protein n=1 Tax=Cacopsylla melanoneura TaxID=428564 RepID=A0A8D9BRX3_9HEMI
MSQEQEINCTLPRVEAENTPRHSHFPSSRGNLLGNLFPLANFPEELGGCVSRRTLDSFTICLQNLDSTSLLLKKDKFVFVIKFKRWKIFLLKWNTFCNGTVT